MIKNLKSPQMRHAHKKMLTWGEWSNQVLTHGLDYSAKNILHQFAKLGIRVQSSGNYEPRNASAEKVDEVLNRLSYKHPHVIKALCFNYTHTGGIRDKAQQMCLPKSTYYDHLCKGLAVLAYDLLYSKSGSSQHKHGGNNNE